MGKVKEFKDKTEERMIPVLDNWCPNFPDDKICVKIMLHGSLPHPKSAKPYYWTAMRAFGADDFMVELVCNCGEYRGDAENLYNYWKKYVFDRIPEDGITVEWFYEHGFVPG